MNIIHNRSPKPSRRLRHALTMLSTNYQKRNEEWNQKFRPFRKVYPWRRS